jgi:hypothetical protein
MKDANGEGKIDPTRIGVEFGSSIVHTELTTSAPHRRYVIEISIRSGARIKEIPPL